METAGKTEGHLAPDQGLVTGAVNWEHCEIEIPGRSLLYFLIWDANGFMPNDWSPALEKGGRPANLSVKFPSPPRWADRTRP